MYELTQHSRERLLKEKNALIMQGNSSLLLHGDGAELITADPQQIRLELTVRIGSDPSVPSSGAIDRTPILHPLPSSRERPSTVSLRGVGMFKPRSVFTSACTLKIVT